MTPWRPGAVPVTAAPADTVAATANTEKATISRLSQEWPNPSTALQARRGRPRCRIDAPSASRPVPSATSAVAVAALDLMLADGTISSDHSVVVALTGSGLKTSAAASSLCNRCS